VLPEGTARSDRTREATGNQAPRATSANGMTATFSYQREGNQLGGGYAHCAPHATADPVPEEQNSIAP
jgi:hypothetical protein